ncbi:hypothetical protein N320_03729, partial [Buceros rhinoceros silvestris]
LLALFQFLDCSTMKEWHDELLQLLTIYLWSESRVMRCLGLRGLVVLSRTPLMAKQMRLMPRWLVMLMQDAEADELRMTLELLLGVLQAAHTPMGIPTALQLAEMLLQLFDHDNDCVQQLSISLFSEVMVSVEKEAEEPLQALVQRSLLPLFFHLHDE